MGLDMSLSRRREGSTTCEVAYWRKANQIHRWFVDNVQGGGDDKQEYLVTPKQLKTLLKLVDQVLQVSVLVPGTVLIGWTWENGKKTKDYEDGRVIKNPAVAQELLPTQEGFFFGSTEYDQYYLEDLKDTKKMLEKVLREAVDGDRLYYSSSW